MSQNIQFQGFEYEWQKGAFLSRSEAEYGLQELWRLTAGTSDWDGEPVMRFEAITREAILRMFALPTGRLPWLAVAGLFDDGGLARALPDRLPAVCQTCPEHSLRGAEMRFPLDLVAAVFLWLTRWEEAVLGPELDIHGRVLGATCFSQEQGFLDRPILDEWASVLRSLLRGRRPGWNIITSRASIRLSHDVDVIRRYPNLYRLIRGIIGQSLRAEWRVAEASRAAITAVRGYLSLAEDPFFRGLLDLCRLDAALDPQPVTYLMSSLRSDQDNGYSLDSRSFTTAVAALRSCRHALGWHPGYYAATDRDRLRLEKSRLEDALGEQVVRSRFHLLRWSAKYSWDDLEAVGIREDSSVGYADLPGFRCGTCHPFQTFSLTQQCRLELVEVPLIIMDATLRGMRRLGTYDRQLLGKLSSRVARAGGTLAVLIHNSFGDFGDEKVLCDLIGELLRFRCDPDCTSPLFDLSLPGAGVIAKCYRQAVAELWHPWEPTGAQ